VLKAGGAYVPMDPAYPVDRLQFMLDDSQPVALLTQQHLASLFAGHTDSVPVLDLTAVAPPWKDSAEDNPDPFVTGLTPQHLAYVIYTSGSTGQPKGVVVTHGGLFNYTTWAVQDYQPGLGSGAALLTPLAFDATVTSLLLPILSGKHVLLLPEDSQLEILANGRADSCRLLKVTPAHVDLLNRLAPIERLLHRDWR
jgi:non-ribosomal peptide synthetase component F